MKKTLASVAAIGALAVPTAAVGHGQGQHVPVLHHRAHFGVVHGAVKACRAERRADHTAFRQKYANKRGRHAFRRCVLRHLKQARATCRAERKADRTAFRTKYANKRGHRAFLRCVRQHSGDPIS